MSKGGSNVFIKTNVSIITEEGFLKEPGYLYKNNLNLIKRGTHSWKLSHEHSGYSVVMLNMPLDLAKQVTTLIHSLVDWSETDKDNVMIFIHEKEGTMEILRELETISTEKEIEEIRDRLLQKTDNNTSISALIDLTVA